MKGKLLCWLPCSVSPLITAYAELPHRGWKPFGWFAYRLFSLPHWGRGTGAARRGWMRDASDKLMLPNFVTLLLQRAYLLGYISQERFLGLALSQFRAYRGAGAGLLEICMHFSSSLRARFARLCVRPNNFCATRFARLACVLITCVQLALPAHSGLPPFGGEGGISTNGRNDG